MRQRDCMHCRSDIDTSRRLQHERELSELRIFSPQDAKMTEGPRAVQGAGAREHAGNEKCWRVDDEGEKDNECGNSHEDVVSFSESPSEKGRLQEQLRMLEWSLSGFARQPALP